MPDYSPAVEPAAGGSYLRVRVVPRARETRLDGLRGEAARLRVAAPPAGGRANALVLGFLGDVLGLRARDLEIVRGLRSRDKTVRVEGLGPATVAARLARPATR